jgi:hypothetical protein
MMLTETEFSKTFYWRTYDCELCKQPFPPEIVHQGKRYKLVDLPKLLPPYIILETNLNAKSSTKGIHMISMSVVASVKLGRGHESDIKIPDISVSRCHAMINFRDGEFFLEDNASKFGTLVLAKDGIQISQSKETISVQIGRTVLICSAGENCWMKMLTSPIPMILN